MKCMCKNNNTMQTKDMKKYVLLCTVMYMNVLPLLKFPL